MVASFTRISGNLSTFALGKVNIPYYFATPMCSPDSRGRGGPFTSRKAISPHLIQFPIETGDMINTGRRRKQGSDINIFLLPYLDEFAFFAY